MQISNPLQTSNPKGLIVLIFAILTLASGGIFLLQQNEKKSAENKLQQQGQQQIKSAIASPIAPYTLVYGDWDGTNSNIKSVNLSTGEYKILASLPSNVKKVSLVESDKLLYIDQTDQQDHGSQLSVVSLSDGKTSPSVKADRGFGIDDYVISKNKQYVATWEVSFSPGSTVLTGGRSRVYTASLANPGAKHLLYDEEVNNPVHYPVGILDDGKVFLDKFKANDPNGNTGWAYGMSVASFDGKQKQDLGQMRAGTYGTQPVLSPDGKNLVFGGYDGSFGLGTNIVSGYRQAILTPNTLELLNTSTLQRQKLPNLSNDNSYTSAFWDTQTGDIVYTVISVDSSASGNFSYNPQTKATTKLDYLTYEGESSPSLVGSLQSDKVLLGVPDNSASSLGNLGEEYGPSFTQFYVHDGKSSTPVQINLPDAFMQYIMLVPNGELSRNTMVVQVAAANTTKENSSAQDNDMINLKSFFLKSDLEAKREGQQSSPAECNGAGTPSGAPNAGTPSSGTASRTAANEPPPFVPGDPNGGGNPSASETPSGAPNKGPECKPAPDKTGLCKFVGQEQCIAKGLQKGSKEYMKCVADSLAPNRKKGICSDSPLYLYGDEGQNVQVTVNTPVYSSGPAYNQGYDVTLSKNGKMYIGGRLYTSIAYDYNPAIMKISPPSRGALVVRSDVAKTLTEYAHRLGLNEQETNDLVAFGQDRVTSEYAYISFFDQKTSEMILPLSFSPKPNNYLNVVFYFKLLKNKPGFTPLPPVFGAPVERTGLTAIEVSELVE